jgi:hypothetical protein
VITSQNCTKARYLTYIRYILQVEEKMSIMSDNIIKEWGAVQDLSLKLIKRGELRKPLNFIYNYDIIPILNESEKIDYLENLHGPLGFISM